MNISEWITDKWTNNKVAKRDYISFELYGDYFNCYIYGNRIGRKNIVTGEVKYCTCGYNTPTTKRRLIDIGCDCKIKNGIIVDKVSNEDIPTSIC